MAREDYGTHTEADAERWERGQVAPEPVESELDGVELAALYDRMGWRW